MLVDLLQGGEDQLLRFLKIAVMEMGEDPPDFVEIDIVFVIGFTRYAAEGVSGSGPEMVGAMFSTAAPDD